MALSVNESVAVGTLLDFLLQSHGRGEEPVDGREAMEAAKVLANSANKRLMAGLDARRVELLWRKKQPRPLGVVAEFGPGVDD